ncbi:MAG: hypothetical protein P9F19_15130 [Candidatus Contendobacter sp.]|nr:hypothetical protein [Candidatus Contendobacter sp.]MDG4558706.1 hypothetical protein [Candidatus Contendobacter sp.]
MGPVYVKIHRQALRSTAIRVQKRKREMPTPVKLSPLAKQVCYILTGGDTAYCNFRFGAQQVSQAKFQDVAWHISVGAIQVTEMPSGTETAAEYYPCTAHPDKKATLQVKASLNQADHIAASNVIHEATHAMQDIQRLILAQEDAEAAAFVAQAIYFHYHRFPEAPVTGDSASDAIMEVAFDIASANVGGFIVDPADEERLRKIILAHPHYRSNIDPVFKYRFPGVAIPP